MPKKKLEPAPTAIMPATPTERVRTLFRQRTLSKDEATEMRALLRTQPSETRRLGNIATQAMMGLIEPLKNESIKLAVEERFQLMRRELAGPDASEVERLLADQAALCWLNYTRIELLYASDTRGGIGAEINVGKLEKWEGILTSAHGRYMRSLETLARVRRLLKLPVVQVNIATEGGQQVNIAGGVS